jgi:hypothetical protein
VTIAPDSELEDSFENMGAELVVPASAAVCAPPARRMVCDSVRSRAMRLKEHSMMEMTPTPDGLMAWAANGAVSMARKVFHDSSLDYSEASIARVEALMGHCARLVTENPEDLEDQATIWGAYVGEVMRRHLHGEWTFSVDEASGAITSTLRIEHLALQPIDRVTKRLIGGPAHNLWSYYCGVREALR